MIEKLTWDSAFFGKEIGTLHLSDTIKFDPLQFKKEAAGYDLIYIMSYDQMLSENTIAAMNVALVDIMITMSRKFNRQAYIDFNFDDIKTLSREELLASYNIADQISKVSRFYSEKAIGIEQTKRMYRKWIENGLKKKIVDAFFVERTDDTIVGVHLVKVDSDNQIGYFNLTGVDENLQKKGIGRKLWYQSFGYFANKTNINIIKSPFSLLNKNSFNFHLKLGFDTIEETKYIYHYRNLAKK